MKQKSNSGKSSAHEALKSLRLRLLDLTGRNPLINFKHSKAGSLRIIDELPDQLVETLLNDTEMSFLAVSEPTEQELLNGGYLELDQETQQIVRQIKEPAAEEWAKHCNIDPNYEVPEPVADAPPKKHTDKKIQTLLYPREMEARLRRLLQIAESAIQEMGANILYLAIGFLEWYESNDSDKTRLAPLFLVPVHLQKGKLNKRTKIYEYTLKYSGEDIISNLSLREKLRADFDLALPDIDEKTPEQYFREVQTLIESAPSRWRIRRYISFDIINASQISPAEATDSENIGQ